MLKPIRSLKSLLENSQKLCLTSRFLIGGVLSLLALALIPNSAYAVDYNAQEVNTSDYNAVRITPYATTPYGCNSVISDAGITAIGPRGSITGADNNPSGCGYYIGHGSDNDGQLTWRDSAASGSVNFDYSGNISSINGSSDVVSYSLNNDDYISKNFRNIVSQVSSTGFDGNFNSNYFTIQPAVNGEKYQDYIFLSFFKVPDGVVWSGLTPSIVLAEQSDISLSGSALAEFYKDIYASTSITMGYPSDELPTDLKNYLALYKQYHNVEDWEEYCFIISYIPRYSTSYTLRRIAYRVDTQQVQDTIDTSLGCFSEFLTGLGNGCSPENATYPKLRYMFLGRSYTKNNAWAGEYLIQDLNTIRFNCVSGTCSDQSIITAKNSIALHNRSISGWDFGGNNGSSWFDVFKINAIYPFSSFFSSLTDSRCVDIPKLASWLYNTNSHVCTYWNDDIRNTLTPVFMSLSTILLFGFVVSWLKGSSPNAFKDNDTNRTGDRF